jgi:hypothetical protein
MLYSIDKSHSAEAEKKATDDQNDIHDISGIMS